ncbi:MAG: polysaccharide pyruvyl transferase family protein [Lachnospiraceae bacterium]|nr:polysaccharide pyruvyl transferase family protein [Lachnospiraceae bacterium]
MEKVYNVLISCYSGEKDAGDETMLLCIREQLEKVLDNSINLTAFSNDPDISEDFNENISFIYSGRHGIKQPGRKGFASIKWIGEMVKAIRKCDILLTGGGTILYDESTPFFVPFWFVKIFIAKFFRKPTAFYGIGVGPLNRKFSHFLMNTFGKSMNFISLRGVESQKWMKKFKVPEEKVFLTADPAVTIYSASDEDIDNYLEKEKIYLESQKDLVVIVLREWFLRKNRGLEQANDGTALITSYDDYIDQMAEFGRYIVEEEDCHIIFMPMGALPPCDDCVVLNAVYDRMREKNIDVSNVFCMSDITDSRIMAGIMGRAKGVVTGRFHGLVYATTQYVPAIGVAYTEKYYDYYNYIGLSDYVISMNDLSATTLIEKYKYMMDNSNEIKDLLKVEIPKQKKNAMKNAEMVKDILCRN